MTNSLHRRQPSHANAWPVPMGMGMGSIPQAQAQDPAPRWMSLYNTIVSIAWLVAFITLIRALAGVGYAGD
jgi:hypothetical protein